MRIYLDNSELSLIPESDDDRQILESFMAKVDKDYVRASMDGVNLDELVIQPWCSLDGSHCDMCGRRFD